MIKKVKGIFWERAYTFCKEEKIIFFYKTVKTGLNIDEAFDFIVRNVIKRRIFKDKIQIQINNSKNYTSNCIC